MASLRRLLKSPLSSAIVMPWKLSSGATTYGYFEFHFFVTYGNIDRSGMRRAPIQIAGGMQNHDLANTRSFANHRAHPDRGCGNASFGCHRVCQSSSERHASVSARAAGGRRSGRLEDLRQLLAE